MRQLGQDYTKNNPISYIISQRLAELQITYGGTSLLGSITRSKRPAKSTMHESTKQYWLDLHMSNLCETYGKDKVIEIYNMIYSLDLTKKIG